MKSRFNGYSFKLDENVTRTKAEFYNRYGIKLVGDLYMPKDVRRHIAGGVNRILISAFLPPRLRGRVGDRMFSAA